ncbi:MAG: DsbE family thiol:disulfide interchange protein [Rhodobacteraceae bacterium]|nr:MAG: DsbE family thiol:disulfide interchange protein [Paracoccaceae bacterium]
MGKFKPLMFLPPVLFVALAALFWFGNLREDRDSLPSAREGQQAPGVVVTQLGELETFDDAALRTGEVTLVNYWASWCAPCRAEHPLLEELAQDLPVFGVNYRDQPDRALDFLDELGNPFAGLVADLPGRMGLDWGLYGVPETYVVAGDGTVMLRFAGPITRDVIANRINPAIERARAHTQ